MFEKFAIEVFPSMLGNFFEYQWNKKSKRFFVICIFTCTKTLHHLFVTEKQEGQTISEFQDFQHDGGSHRTLEFFFKTLHNVPG